MKFNRQSLALLLIGAAFGAILAVVMMTLANRTRPAAIIIQPPAFTATPAETATPEPIRVYVSGAVVLPGVYDLAAEAIVQDVIEAAGGFSAEAQVDLINLAQPLVNGMQINVPDDSETVRAQVAPVFSVPDSPAGNPNDGNGALAIVNINTANVGELDTLPGIGPSTAQKIVDYRDENGPFTSIEMILNVSGIGEAKFEQIAPFITIGP